MEGILTMSSKEVDRIKIISQVEKRIITIGEAAELLRLSERQLYRIIKKVKEEGSKGIIHKLRGKTSNRGYPKKLKKKIIEIYRKQYWDYGPTLFSEMLIKHHSIAINDETLRLWLRAEAITTSIRKKSPHRKKEKEEVVLGKWFSLMEVIMIGLKEEGLNAAC